MKDKEKQDYTQVQARLLAKHLIESENRRKEKQIEEMVKDLKEEKLYALINKTSYMRSAENLYDLGYRKLPEDSVVLSKEEYAKLKRVETEKDRLYEIKLDLENQLIEKGWTDYEGADEIEKRVIKETAEKFANEVYKELYQLGKIYALPETLDADKYGIFSLTQEVVAKIAKEQFGVGIKE